VEAVAVAAAAGGRYVIYISNLLMCKTHLHPWMLN
jgi:hypothetical protein